MGENSWAVVTGGAKGIGRGFCEEFAKQSLNVMILDWDKNEGNKLAKELS